MPQRDSLLPWRRAWPNALLGARLTGDDGEDVRGHAAALFERFGLAGFERAWPHELSGGMRQRLALLRTVLAGRRLLLLDEPFSGLDPLTRRSMNRWLRDVDLVRAGRGDGAVVLVTHDVDEALLLADRVLVMSARPGRVLAVVPAADRGEAARERLLGLLGAGAVSRTSGNPAW
jgi:ABC-type nitrate/sulfonate/bicarbonate transport system ATPase subunit